LPPDRRTTPPTGFQWTIARKIGGLAAVFILFILLLLLYSIVTLRGIQGELKEIAELDVPLTELINRIEIEQLEQQITMDRLLRRARRQDADGNIGEFKDAKERLQNHSAALNRHIEAGLLLSAAGAETLPLFVSITAALAESQRDVNRLYSGVFDMLATIEAGGYPDAETIEAAVGLSTALDESLLSLLERVEAFTNREIQILENHERVFLLVNTSLGVAGVLLGVGLTILVIVGIRTNLFRLKQSVSAVTHSIAENREIERPSIDVASSDEIADLAEDVHLMLEKISNDIRQREEFAKRMQLAATTDPLTGAYNRRKWEEDLEIEIERVKRSHDEMSIILFDIDHFKDVNDTFGHDEGDKVLVGVVTTVTGAIRKADALYRIGGEEFVVLAPYTDRAHVGVLAEKIRASVQGQAFDTVGGVTVSLGCAQFDKQESDGARLYKSADACLYRAKQSGRNVVCVEDGP